jgi:hypothetical protein
MANESTPLLADEAGSRTPDSIGELSGRDGSVNDAGEIPKLHLALLCYARMMEGIAVSK